MIPGSGSSASRSADDQILYDIKSRMRQEPQAGPVVFCPFLLPAERRDPSEVSRQNIKITVKRIFRKTGYNRESKNLVTAKAERKRPGRTTEPEQRYKTGTKIQNRNINTKPEHKYRIRTYYGRASGEMKEIRNKMTERTGKKKVSVLMASLFTMGMLTATACGMLKDEFRCTENSEKVMTFEAVNASKDGEELEITPDLNKGMMKLEFIPEDEEQSIDKLPDLDKDALITAEVSGTGMQTYGIPSGSYMVRVTVTEKAKGTVTARIQAE